MLCFQLPNHPVPCASASQDQQRLSLTSSGRERSKIESGPFVQSSPQAATSPFLYHHRHHEFRIGTSGGLPPTPSSPTTAIFAFHPPAFPDPASHHEAITHSRRESLHTSSSTLPPQTGISSGHRPYSSYTPRLSTSATSIMADPSVSVHEPARADAELACVRNLVGALTTNGHTLRAPGESRNGIWFVFHDLRWGLFCNLSPVSIGDLLKSGHQRPDRGSVHFTAPSRCSRKVRSRPHTSVSYR